MSGICGWIGYKEGTRANKELIQRMVDCVNPYHGSESRIALGTHSALGINVKNNQSDICQQKDVLAAIHGDISWGDPGLGKLSDREGSAKALLLGYKDLGIEVLHRIRGSFSAALISESQDEAIIATDRVGIKPVSYFVGSDCLVFSSEPSAIQQHPMVSCDINRQAIFNYLYFHVVPAPSTIYSDHKRLLPGTYARFREGVATTHQYWKMGFEDEHKNVNLNELKKEFLSVLRSSVRGMLSNAKTGAFLSGGTDSSTVSGILSETLGAPAPTYSIGFNEEGYDEMQYARIASKHFGTDHHEYYVTPDDVVTAIPKIARSYSEPYGNSSAVPTYYCAKLARSDGVARLLAGDGGDELFAGNERYARQTVFARYERIPSFLRKSVIEPITRSKLLSDKYLIIRKSRSYIQQASFPMPDRLQTYNLLERLGVTKVLNPDFIREVDVTEPLFLQQQYYQGVEANSLINKMLGFDLKFTLADNDLPKVSTMCELAGVGVAYPLLSDEMVRFSSRIPPTLKLKGTKLRFFFKEALKEFLPAETLSKQKHGFGLPFGLWLVSHKRISELVKDNVGDLRSRHILRAKFIDELLSNHLKAHSHYYGNMVWVLLMLELWFKTHVD